MRTRHTTLRNPELVTWDYGDRERDGQQPGQRAVRMSHCPHQPTRLVADIEIQSLLEPMEPLENDSRGGEHLVDCNN